MSVSTGRVLTSCLLLVAAAAAPLSARAAEGRRADDSGRRVELFAAMLAGEIDVRFIPADATAANVMIRNKTDKPLSVRLPAAFAGVPAQAQLGFPGGPPQGLNLPFGRGGGGGGGAAAGQGLGAAAPGGGPVGGGNLFGGGGPRGGGNNLFGAGLPGGGMPFGGRPGGFFHVPAEKVRKVRVACVCLEHGKPDPTPRMEYRIVPIESFVDDPRLIEVCKMLAWDELPQNAVQAAAWHLADGLRWTELAAKNRRELRSAAYVEKFFSRRELDLAAQLVSVAGERVRHGGSRGAAASSPGELAENSRRGTP